jgi:hypothetical protein
MYHLSHQQSRASQNSILSNNSLNSGHSGHSAHKAGRVASPSPSIREDESAFPNIPVIPPEVCVIVVDNVLGLQSA